MGKCLQKKTSSPEISNYILASEYEYIANSAIQANEDRAGRFVLPGGGRFFGCGSIQHTDIRHQRKLCHAKFPI